MIKKITLKMHQPEDDVSIQRQLLALGVLHTRLSLKPQETQAESWCFVQAFQGHQLRALSAFGDSDNSRQTEPVTVFPLWSSSVTQ